MKKVIVIGSSGAGKSTFSRRLHAVTGLPLFHLDRLFWKPGWVETADKDEWRAEVAEVMRGSRWILDGNYGGTMEMRLEACDTVIFLDFPNYVCAWRVFKRMLRYRGGGRPDMAEGCRERFDPQFIKWTWQFPARSKPGVEEKIKRCAAGKNVIRLKSNREVESFFVNLKADRLNSN